uniref:Uncharacterized protein n=1 Tax=Rhizophora mucronata TaxID=61149 RepID=A0A2P2N8P9_RHIMU
MNLYLKLDKQILNVSTNHLIHVNEEKGGKNKRKTMLRMIG